MKKRLQNVTFQIERLESKDLPSGLAAAPHAALNVVTGHRGSNLAETDALHHANDVAHSSGFSAVDGGGLHSPRNLNAMPAVAGWTSRLFQENASFQFRAINSSATQTARLQLGAQQYPGFTLAVRPYDLPPRDGRRPELLDFNFQSTTPLLQNGKFTFGPLGLPTNIPVLQKVRLTGIYMYFTQNDARINNTTTFGPLFKLKADPLDPKKTDLFLSDDTLITAGGFYVLNRNGGFTLLTADFTKFKVPVSANGVRIGIEVMPV